MKRTTRNQKKEISLTVVVREKRFKFTVKTSPGTKVGELKAECLKVLNRETYKKKFAVYGISIGAVKEVRLKLKKDFLEDDDKTLAECQVIPNARLEAQVRWVEYGVKSMLHFRCRVNGVGAVGFVDTGCVLSTLSTDFVRRLGLQDQVDARFAYGVSGPAGDRVHGCIHEATLEMGGQDFVTNFDVMDSDKDVWLGMNLIYREGIAVDVANSVLRIASTNTQVDLVTLEQAQRATLDEQPAKRLKRE